jgi:hypothetical protein
MSFPAQKIASSKKNEQWYRDNLEAACSYSRGVASYHKTWKARRENYLLSIGELDVHSVGKEIDFQNQGLDSYPIQLKHIGIGNSKINVLLGDYFDRRTELRAFISNADEEGITRKENDLKQQMLSRMMALIQSQFEAGQVDQKYVEAETQKLEEWATYEYQDVAEITANQILKHEYNKKNISYTMAMGFKDLLVQGKVAYWIDEFGKDIDLRKIDPMTVTAVGGSSPYLHERDYIIVEQYKSLGQVYDDYWDKLKEKDRTELEDRMSNNNSASWGNQPAVWSGEFATAENFGDKVGYPDGLSNMPLFKGNDWEQMPTGAIWAKNPYVNSDILETTVFWKSRRKLGELTTLNEFGMPEVSYVSENYISDKFAGETIKWFWVNEWCRATKLGADIIINYGPIESACKSLTNLSTGLPPIIGVEVAQSMMDIIKPLDLEYDKAYWKRSVLLSQMQGTKTAVNVSMVPNGVDPKEWLHMANIDQIVMLDPTQEVLSGPLDGKAASAALNTFITQDIKFGTNHEQIQALTDYLINLEYTMGKICGVNGTREGEVGERQAVRNTQLEMAQFSKITEHWFQLEEDLKRVVFKKFLEIAKTVYKKYPIKGSYILNDLSQEFIQNYQEFAESEFDIHVNNATADGQLMQKLQASVDAAISAGQGTLEDLLTVNSTGSIQSIARRLRESSRKIRAEQQQIQEAQNKAAMEAKQMDARENQVNREHEIIKLDKTIEIQKYKVDRDNETKLAIADSNLSANSEVDLVDDRELDLADIALKTRDLQEKERSNRAKEDIAREKNQIARNKPRPSTTKK